MLDNQPPRAINVLALCRDVHKEGGAVRRGGVTTLRDEGFDLAPPFRVMYVGCSNSL